MRERGGERERKGEESERKGRRERERGSRERDEGGRVDLTRVNATEFVSAASKAHHNSNCHLCLSVSSANKMQDLAYK